MQLLGDFATFARPRGARDRQPRKRRGAIAGATRDIGVAGISAASTYGLTSPALLTNRTPGFVNKAAQRGVFGRDVARQLGEIRTAAVKGAKSADVARRREFYRTRYGSAPLARSAGSLKTVPKSVATAGAKKGRAAAAAVRQSRIPLNQNLLGQTIGGRVALAAGLGTAGALTARRYLQNRKNKRR